MKVIHSYMKRWWLGLRIVTTGTLEWKDMKERGRALATNWLADNTE